MNIAIPSQRCAAHTSYSFDIYSDKYVLFLELECILHTDVP